jgi:hypothetical protein
MARVRRNIIIETDLPSKTSKNTTNSNTTGSSSTNVTSGAATAKSGVTVAKEKKVRGKPINAPLEF